MPSRFFARAAVASMALAATALHGQSPATRSTTFWNVGVVDLESGKVNEGLAVEVANGRIVRVDPASGTAPANTIVIDGRAKYLIPGLWDTHVHLTKLGAPSLSLLIANGVTSVRDMGSDLADVQLWRKEIASGVRVGPRIKTSGPILESRANVERMKREKTVEPVDRLRVPVGSPAEAQAAVDRLADAGVDFLKIRTVANPETFAAIAAAARARNLDLAGHVPPRIDDAIEARMASVEHLIAIPPLEAPPEKRRAIFDRMRAAGVRMGTTTVNLENSVFLSYAEAMKRFKEDPRRRFVTKYLASDWAEQIGEKQAADAASQIDVIRKMAPLVFRDLREMHAAGVAFLTGSDAAVALVYPGWSLHGELESLVRNVGLTPAEALRAATMNPAALFHLEKELGAIEPGYRADLVLLAGDPLRDIRRTQQIAGVMQDGRWLDRKMLAALLERAAREAAR
jgi:imidazolonepropionase-like amidohydrolase